MSCYDWVLVYIEDNGCTCARQTGSCKVYLYTMYFVYSLHPKAMPISTMEHLTTLVIQSESQYERLNCIFHVLFFCINGRYLTILLIKNTKGDAGKIRFIFSFPF